MIITMRRPAGAPFSLFSTVEKSVLIPDQDIKNFDTLSWESTVVKNYCLAVTMQKEFDLEKIKGLKEIQASTRQTGHLWLKGIAIQLDELYLLVSRFCSSYQLSYKELKATVPFLDTEHGKIKFNRIISLSTDRLTKIQIKIEDLTAELTEFRELLERDNRDFQDILERAAMLKASNKFRITTLQYAIEGLTNDIQKLNSQIARAATVGTMGVLSFIIGVILIVKGVVDTGVTLGGSLLISAPIIAAGIGMIAGSVATGVEYAHMGQYIRERNEKNNELKKQSEELRKLQNEVSALTALEQQYQPLIATASDARTVVYELFRGWSAILSNFKDFLDQLDQAKHPVDKAEISAHLKTALTRTEEIAAIVQKHESTGLIDHKQRAPISGLLAPSYQGTKPLVLPMPLYSAYVSRMHESDFLA